ncbi:hypothetical protein [Bifidobacterium adolescentis]|nr:hypothetical protein [Bifidobacterium adolescentis]
MRLLLQGLPIAIVEEIAFENGWITRDQLMESAERYGKSPYSQHLKGIADGEIMLVPNQKEFIFERYPSQGCFLIFYRYLDAARILRDMCICCIWQKVKETVKDVWGFLKTFLSTEHPGLNNVADFLTVIISAASIIIAFASYNYTKDHDQQIAKFAQANEISSWVMHDAKGNIQKTEDMSLMKVSIDNGSDQPIYDVVLTSGTYQGAGSDYLSGTDFTACIGTVPPGKFATYVPCPGEGMHARIESAIAFRDNKGNNWIRDAKGILSEIKTNPYEYLKLDLPPENWQSLKSEGA